MCALLSGMSQSSPQDLKVLACGDDLPQLAFPVVVGKDPSKLRLPHLDVLVAPEQCKVVSGG